MSGTVVALRKVELSASFSDLFQAQSDFLEVLSHEFQTSLKGETTIVKAKARLDFLFSLRSDLWTHCLVLRLDTKSRPEDLLITKKLERQAQVAVHGSKVAFNHWYYSHNLQILD